MFLINHCEVWRSGKMVQRHFFLTWKWHRLLAGGMICSPLFTLDHDEMMIMLMNGIRPTEVQLFLTILCNARLVTSSLSGSESLTRTRTRLNTEAPPTIDQNWEYAKGEKFVADMTLLLLWRSPPSPRATWSGWWGEGLWWRRWAAAWAPIAGQWLRF